uniref:Uncharacterized protein n=1 Tax=Panagrolaimus sp. ES5 TaxID=591445 RepID=A0AC34GSW2_9BILA
MFVKWINKQDDGEEKENYVQLLKKYNVFNLVNPNAAKTTRRILLKRKVKTKPYEADIGEEQTQCDTLELQSESPNDYDFVDDDSANEG